MADFAQDTHALTDFVEHSDELLRHVRETKRPLRLTVESKTEFVIQEWAGYQRLLDIAARAEANEGIRQGREDVVNGRTRPAREAMGELRDKHGLAP